MGPNEFEWEIKSPDYDQLEDQYEIFDTSAIMLIVSYKEKEFLRISYLIIHEYQSEENRENPPDSI